MGIQVQFHTVTFGTTYRIMYESKSLESKVFCAMTVTKYMHMRSNPNPICKLLQLFFKKSNATYLIKINWTCNVFQLQDQIRSYLDLTSQKDIFVKEESQKMKSLEIVYTFAFS